MTDVSPAITSLTEPLPTRLAQAGLRPTRQRLALARLIFGAGDRHVTAEELHREVLAAGARVSLATVYNTLRHFTAKGLLREVQVAPDRHYFDTNVGDHHHFYWEAAGRLIDIPAGSVAIGALPDAPPGARIAGVDIIVRLDDHA